MFDKLKRILDANDSLSMGRARIVATFCDSCALTYHVLIFFVFIFLKVYPMVIYNVFSIALFTFTLFRIKKADSFVRIYSWCSAEVIPHQILSDYFLGTNANFHFFILLMGLIPFLIFKNKSKFLVPFAAFTSLLFIIIENCRNQPEYEIALFTQSVLRLANVSLSVGIIFFMILIFTYIVDNYETKLHKINQTLESEIALASVIQQNFFRQDLAEVKNVEISFYNKPMAGVFDAANENGEEFGVSRFMHVIEANASKKISVNEQAAALVREIELFRGKKAQTDDLTFIILKNTLES